MGLSLALASYFICWWLVLFAVLPMRLGPQPKEGTVDTHAQASGAPLAPNLGLKFVVTTVISAVLFAVFYAVVEYKIVTLDDIPFLRL